MAVATGSASDSSPRGRRSTRSAPIDAWRRTSPGQRAIDLDAAIADGDAVWLFSSSEAITNLEQAAGPGRFRAARAVATHPRIAARARSCGFRVVVEAAPGLEAVIACLQSMPP